jgi:hypothetical protein
MVKNELSRHLLRRQIFIAYAIMLATYVVFLPVWLLAGEMRFLHHVLTLIVILVMAPIFGTLAHWGDQIRQRRPPKGRSGNRGPS